MIKPVGKNILGMEVEDFKINEEERKSSIILPEEKKDGWKNYRIVEVQAVGSGKSVSSDEKDIEMPYVIGQRLIIKADAVVELEDEDKKYIIFNIKNVIAEIK